MTTKVSHRFPVVSIPRCLAALGLTALVVAWGGWQRDRTRAAAAWDQRLATATAAELGVVSRAFAPLPRRPTDAADSPAVRLAPPTPEALSASLGLSAPPVRARAQSLERAALALETRAFPPDHTGALRLLGAALEREPLRSSLWMRVAAARLFSGDRRRAEKALRRSDALDPAYPAQRLDAVRLWRLLGDRDHALDLAYRLSVFGPVARARVVDSLMQMGLQPAEVFETLRLGEETPPAELARLLSRLRTSHPAAMQALFSVVPERLYEDPDFRTAAARAAWHPPIYERLVDLWLRHARSSDSLERVVVAREATATTPAPEGDSLDPTRTDVFLDNPRLTTPPFAHPFPLGWQRPPAAAWYAVSWVPPASDGPDRGAIRIVLDGAGRSGRQSLGWLLYRLALPPETNARIRIPIRCDPPGLTGIHMVARLGSGPTRVARPVAIDTRGNSELLLAIPPHPEAETVELTLGWRGTHPLGSRAELRLLGLELEIHRDEESDTPGRAGEPEDEASEEAGP